MIWVDGHVHFYACYDADLFFRSAAKNFAEAADGMGVASNDRTPPYLLLAEADGVDRFGEWRRGAHSGGFSLQGWHFAPTAEPESLVVRGPEGAGFFVVAGRQLVTLEGLEVLGLCTGARLDSGLSLAETVRAVRAAGGVAVLPWGFGKWWFGRGRRLRRYLRAGGWREVALGDNGGRPARAVTPRLFAEAAALGVAVLPGSDPLPFRGEERRVGSCGFALLGARPDVRRPVRTLRRALRGATGGVRPFGKFQSWWDFGRSQILLQLRKRRLWSSGC